MSADVPAAALPAVRDGSPAGSDLTEVQRKRHRFIQMAEEAAIAMEAAAKKIKLAATAAEELADAHPTCLGATDANEHFDELNRKAAGVWAATLEGKVVLQETAVITSIRDRHERARRLDRTRVAEVMDIRDPTSVRRASFLD